MIPLLGVFRIVAIVILGTLFYLLPTLCVCVFNMFDSHLLCVFLQLGQILDLPSTDDSARATLV